jgi:hypothetical protein
MTNFITSAQTVPAAFISNDMWKAQTNKTSQLSLYGEFLQDAIQGAVCDALVALLGEASYDQLDHVLKAYTREFTNGGNQVYACKSKAKIVDMITEYLSDSDLVILEGISPEFQTLLKGYDANVRKSQEEASATKPPSTGQTLPPEIQAKLDALTAK